MTSAASVGVARPSGRVLRVLTAAEARRLVRHPFVILGAGFALIVLATAGPRTNAAFDALAGYGLMPLSIGTCLAAHLLASRDVRNDTIELWRAMPTPPTARTLAALTGLLGPVAVGVALVAIGGTLLDAWDGVPVALTRGRADLLLHPSEVAQGIVGVAFFGALGIAVGVWIPSRVALVVLVAALLLMFTVVGWYAEGWLRWALPMTHHEYGIDRWVQAADGAGYYIVRGYDRVAMTWHVLYVSAFTGLLGSVAVLRHNRSRRAVAWAAGLAAVTVMLAVIQVP